MGNVGFQELLLISLMGVGIALIPTIFYLLTLQKALQTVSPENRKMEPGLVWLLVIPFFRWVWNFFVVDAIGTSFKREYEKYGIYKAEKPSYNLGLTLAILECCFIVPLLNVLAILGALVIWIVYWVKVNEIKNELLNLKQTYTPESGEKSIFVS